eukprot:3114623-Rhodomonas_salina.2
MKKALSKTHQNCLALSLISGRDTPTFAFPMLSPPYHAAHSLCMRSPVLNLKPDAVMLHTRCDGMR